MRLHDERTGVRTPEAKKFLEVRKQTHLDSELAADSPRCSLTRALRAETSGRFRYEKCPGRGLEKESVFFPRPEAAGGTSGLVGAGSSNPSAGVGVGVDADVDAGVGVEIGAGVSPSTRLAS